MIISIQIDTSVPLSDSDLDLLYKVAGIDGQPPASEYSAVTPEVDDDEPEPAPKATPARKTAAKKYTAKKAAKPAPVEEDEEKGVDEAALRKEALGIAQNLLRAGEREKVTAALTEVNATRVSEVDGDDLQSFIDLLEA